MFRKTGSNKKDTPKNSSSKNKVNIYLVNNDFNWPTFRRFLEQFVNKFISLTIFQKKSLFLSNCFSLVLVSKKKKIIKT